MKDEYIFFTVFVPGPRNLKDKLNVYMQLLMNELKNLWEVGVEIYDALKKGNFNLWAALM